MPTPGAQYILNLQARMAELSALTRLLTDDEVTIFAAAHEAGGTINTRVLRDYLAGKATASPIQFEGCVQSVHAQDEWSRQIVAENAAKRDAFLARLYGGDLAPVLARVNGKTERRAA